ncbi:MAG: hypothetical protein ABSF83_09990, partial [Nitrososphaerales archaeon]
RFITDLVAALGSVGIETTKGHVEGGKGQLEFDIVHHQGMKPATVGQLDAMLEDGIKTSRANFAFSHNDGPVRGAAENISQGDLGIVADPDTFVVPSYTTGIGRFLGDVHEKDGSVSRLCTRSFYRRMLERASSKGYRLAVGFEGEFHLVRRDESGRVVRVDDFHTHSQEGFNVYHRFITDLVAALGSVGIETTKGHVEGGKGQLEFDIVHHQGMKPTSSTSRTRRRRSRASTGTSPRSCRR